MNASRKSKTKYAVLGMLSLSDKSAYEISKAIANSTAFFWSESDGQIYPILKRLCEEGLVFCSEIDQKPARAKKIYQLTSEGLEDLVDWLHSTPTTFNIRNEFLLQLFFGHNVTFQDNVEKIEALKIQLKQQLKVFDGIEKRINEHSRFPTYLLLSLSYGQYGLKAEIAWCDEAIKKLKNKIQEKGENA